jgi:signal transduction histidine kinase/ligand-binding sensor domain-containing protein/DNA-binding response OmpR family regulator
MRKYLFLIILILPIWLFPNTQSIKKLQINQGLSNNYIQGITQDRQGFMWFGTESGLNRFDGREFKKFYNSDIDPNTINSNELNDVYADKFQDIIWIATERSGLNGYNYRTHQFSFYLNDESPNSLSSNGIMFLSGEHSGNLWVTTYQSGVDLFDKKTNSFIHYNQSTVKGLNSNYNRCAIDDEHGNLYIGHLFSGLSVVSIKSKTAVNYMPNPKDPNSLPSKEVYTLFIDSKKRIWVGTNNGLALFHPEKKIFTVFRKNKNPGSLSSNIITAIREVNDQIWFGTVAGIDVLEEQYGIIDTPENVEFKHIVASDAQSGLSHPLINSIFQDKYKNVWVGTLGGGVNFLGNITDYFNTIVHSPFTKSSDNLNNKCVRAMCFDTNNQLWIGTEGGGVDIFNNGVKVKNYSMENSLIPDNRILSIFKDSHNNMWLGTFEGAIMCYNSSNNQFSMLKGFDIQDNQIWGFYEDSYQNLWIAAENGLYTVNLKSGLKRIFTNENSKLNSRIVRTISGDKSGHIWVGTLGGGLQVFTSDFQLVRSFSTGDDFYDVTNILRDSKNRMWVATRQDLILFKSCNDRHYVKYGLKDGLADNYIRAIAEGVNDNFWISTNRGLSCLNVKNGQIKNYNEHDGIPIGNFMSGAVTKSTNGTIYFGSENGICYFNSNELIPTYDLPKVIITNFSIVEKQSTHTGNFSNIPISDKIELNYNQSTFGVSFNILDYSLNDMVEFSYQMKGLDDGWFNTDNEKTLIFRNLLPGNYQLSIKTRLRNQDWSEKVTTLQIYIHPPFWFSWWAESIYAILILFISVYIIRFYKNKVNLENSLLFEKKTHAQEQELNEERLRFFTNITHELRTPLTLIIGPLEDIVTDQRVEPTIAKKINSIHRSANRLLELINQILEFRKSETRNRKLNVVHDDISVLVQEVGLKYKELNRNQNVDLDIVVPKKSPNLYYDTEVITIILDNLISNALKYTPKGKITLTLQNSHHDEIRNTEIVVSDTGYGISEETLPRIFDRYYQAKSKHQMSGTGIGLSLVKNMIELHQGTIRVESTIGQGTKFTLSLLTENTYPEAIHATIYEQNELGDIEITQSSNQLILVVEDNEEIRDYIKECFADNYEIVAVENGKMGLQIAQSRIPDIIISDIMMPVMDGMEMCKQIKEDVKTSHIPVILLTAKDTIQDKTEGYNIGADSYITKPFSAKLLQSRVNNLLDARKKMTALFSTSNVQKQALLKESLSRLDNEFIEKVIGIIEQNIESEQINIAQIADRMFMSHSTLYRKLKALTGMTINEFIRKIRLSTAEKLLLTGKYTINEIIYMVGINSTNYFRECFKDEFGVTPKEYIQKIRENQE